MNSIPNFQSDQPAKEVDSALKSALKIKDAAHQCSLDWFAEILNRKLFQELGYSSINQYARQELGFSNSKIGDYIQLARKLEQLPHLKDSLSSGKLGYTKGRLLAGVANEKTEKEWIGFAEVNTRQRVEEEVKRAKKQAKDQTARQPSLLPKPARKTPAAVVPVRVNLSMTPSQFARYEALWEKLRKQRNVVPDKVEALLTLMDSFLATSSQNASPRGDDSRFGAQRTSSTQNQPAAQIHIHHCPDCQSPGCNHTGYLEIHHILPRVQGGNNNPTNLRCLCSACHRLVHARNSGFIVKSPTTIYHYSAQSSYPSKNAITNPNCHLATRFRTSHI